MRTYTVDEIAMMLNVNSETVRRWTRSGRLVASIVSKKEGLIVDECDLYTFTEANPKYAKRLPKLPSDDTYFTGLRSLLNDLISERNLLNERIRIIQNLLEGD